MLLGSFIFLGFLSAKPVLAQQSSFSETTEQKTEIQDDKTEDEEMYEKLLEKNPRNVEVLKVLLTAKMKKGKSKEAVKYVERLIDIEPNEVEWRLLQALCYEMMGQLSKSKRLFKEILKKRPLLLRALHVWFFTHFFVLLYFYFFNLVNYLLLCLEWNAAYTLSLHAWLLLIFG